MVTSIQLEEKTKGLLDRLKIHYRETYDELVMRLAEAYSKNADKGQLIETIEIISDPEAMREIAEGIEAYEKGKGKSIKKLRKELGV